MAPILEALEVSEEGWPESAGTLISKFRALREDGAELTISIADEANLVSADATRKIVAPEGTVALKPSAESTVVLKTPQAEGTIVLQKPAESTVMLDPETGNRQQATEKRKQEREKTLDNPEIERSLRCSLFPVPCSLFPVPCSLFLLPCSQKEKVGRGAR